MKSIIFDTGPIISLAVNNLLWITDSLRKHYPGKFCIPQSVKKELVDRPLATKKFKFEALRVLHYINKGSFQVVSTQDIEKKTIELLNLANNCFQARGKWIRIVHYADMETVASAILLDSDAFVVDERTTRLLIENPEKLANILRKKLGTPIEVNTDNLKEIKNITKGLKIIRSSELVTRAFELGLLDKFLADIPNPKETLLDGVLWAVKLNGCAISKAEIEHIIGLEMK